MPLIARTIQWLLVAAVVAAACPEPALADGTVRIKLGTIAPRGSKYHRTLQEMGEAWRRAEGPGAEFIIYTDGSQGSEVDMVRRMRVGQLNAAAMSVIGLSEIDPAVGALQKMPLAFRSWEEVAYVSQALHPVLESRLREKGFVVLLWLEAGWVRFFSTQPGAHPDDFRTRKVFAWAGDGEQVELMKRLGYRPVVLETADIFPGLQTGLIDTVPVTAMWALATQVDRLAPYMVDIKWAPIVGALVVTRKSWDAMTPAGRDALTAAARAAAADLHSHQVRAEEEAVAAMKKRGLTVQPLDPELEAAWRRLAEGSYPMLRGRTVPAETFDEVLRLLAEYRNTTPKR